MEGYPSPELQGIIPNVFEHVFSKITLDDKSTHLVRASYLEIYLEEVRDLLSSTPQKSLPVKLRKTANGEEEFFVKDLTMFIVKESKELERILKVGQKNRVVAETGMNMRSSRSHAIFSITIETSTPSTTNPSQSHVRVGKLNLVDLAGSERQEKTHATGEQFTQATKINLSLVTLGMVINQLVLGAQHIPYRDSNLTRLLQSSLGGSCKTVMIANISPASFNYDESLGTLRYAAHAKKIKNTPKINEDPKDAMIREYESELKRLRDMIAAKRGGAPLGNGTPGLGDSTGGGGNGGVSPELMEQLRKQTDEEVSRILAEKGMAESDVDRVKAQMKEVSARKQAERAEREGLEKKLKMMESKLVGGAQSLIDENQKQRALLERQRLALEQRHAEEAKLQRQLLERKERKEVLAGRVSDMEQTRRNVDSKLKELQSAHAAAKLEIRDMEDAYRKEKEEELERIRVLKSELKLRSLILRSFVPKEEVEKVRRRVVYDEERECWALRPIAAEELQLDRNVLSTTGQPRRAGDVTPTMASMEFGSSLALDMPETHMQEYESNLASRRLSAQLHAAISEGDGEGEVALRASENLPNVFLSGPLGGDDDEPSLSKTPVPKTIRSLVQERSRANSDPPQRRKVPLGVPQQSGIDHRMTIFTRTKV